MESIARPLRRLQTEASWFARAQELKLLHVRTDATLREAALGLLMGQENHSDNRALYFRFDDVVDTAGGAWADRAARLRAEWGGKTASIAAAGIHLRPLGEITARSPGADFAATLLRTAAVWRPP